MNEDIRVKLGFFSHRKTRKLIAKFGLDAGWGLLQLWVFAARSRSDGFLAGMTHTDIVMEMHLEGKVNPEDLVVFMASDECRWLDETPTGLYLHDWHIHNPWAAGAVDRSDIARFNAMSSKYPLIHKSLSIKGVTAISKIEYQRLTKPQRMAEETQQTASDALDSAQKKPAPNPSPAPAPAPAPESNTTAPPAAPVSAAKGKKKSRSDGYAFPGIPDWIGEREWNEYVEMRKRRSPLTDWGKHLTVLDLEKLRAAGYDPNAVLNQSTQKSWRGVFKIDGGNHGAHSGGTQGSGHPKAEPGKYANLRPGEKVCTSDEL